jgi:hypothetical protein
MSRSGGRSAYDRVKALELDINQQVLVTFDPDAVPDAPAHNPGLHPDSWPNEPFIAGKRTGALVGTISAFRHADGLVTFTTEHGTVYDATEGCPVWRVRS